MNGGAARKLGPFGQRMCLWPAAASAAAGRIHPRIHPRIWNPAERPVVPGWVAWCGARPVAALVRNYEVF